MREGIWWTRRGSARWAYGRLTPASWDRASPSSVRFSASAGTATVATWRSPAAGSGRRLTQVRLPRIGWRVIGCCWRSWRRSRKTGSELSRPSLRVPRLDLVHHLAEGVVEIDPLTVGHADQHEDDVGHLHPQVAVGLTRLLGLPAKAMVHLAGQLAHLLAQPGHVGERVEIAFLELGDPGIDPAL